MSDNRVAIVKAVPTKDDKSLYEVSVTTRKAGAIVPLYKETWWLGLNATIVQVRYLIGRYRQNRDAKHGYHND